MGKYIGLFEISYFAFLTPPSAHQNKRSSRVMLLDLWNPLLGHVLQGLWDHCGKADKENICNRIYQKSYTVVILAACSIND